MRYVVSQEFLNLRFFFCLFPEIPLPELFLAEIGYPQQELGMRTLRRKTPLFIGNLWIMVKEQTGLRVELITL